MRTDRHRNPAPLPVDRRELLDAAALADLFACSRSQILQMDKEGSLPASVLFRSVPRWRRREIVDWVASGLPHRDEWKWAPAAAIKLRVYRDALLKEATAIQEEIHAAEARLARGESMTMVRRVG